MRSYFQNDDIDASIHRYQSSWKVIIALPMLHIVGINFITILDKYLVLCTKNEFQSYLWIFPKETKSRKGKHKKVLFFSRGASC